MNEKFGLYLILTDPRAGYTACAQAAVDCDLRYLQLRMKNSPRAEIIETANAIRQITRGTATRFIVNDDLSIAMEVDADGIHLGQDDMSVAEAKQIWGMPGKIIGLSTHTLEQAQLARSLRPDYIGIGPVYSTATKPDAAPALGPQETGRIAQQCGITSVSIGGINTENLAQVLAGGTKNFCVVNAVNSSDKPAKAIRKLQAIWKSHCF